MTQNGRKAASAVEAWFELQGCGLEINGRDADLGEMLRLSLNRTSKSLDDALATATLEQFVLGFFSVAGPYVDMLKDLLGFFERASATHGPHQWQLAFDGYLAEVESFKHSLETIVSIAQPFEVPALSWADATELLHAVTAVDAVRTSVDAVRTSFDARFHKQLWARDTRVAEWVQGYNSGDFPLLPASLAPPMDAPAWLGQFWACVMCVHATLKNAFRNRDGAKKFAKSVSHQYTPANLYAVDSLASLDSDHWLRSAVVALSVLVRDTTSQKMAQERVCRLFDGVGRTTLLISTEVSAVETFISLPVWRKRHEFFAAWVAAEMIAAVQEHHVKINHEEGRISLPFTETVVAQIESTTPKLKLLSEKRVPLIDPVGKGRKSGVQPDFGWWETNVDLTSTRCLLVVEVKHYKKPVVKSWSDVFSDYARAHESARIILVNYGPAGNALKNIAPDWQSRCVIIGDLRPSAFGACALLKEEVRRIIGTVTVSDAEAFVAPANAVLPIRSSCIIAVDVSASMPPGPVVEALLIEMITVFTPDWLAAIDTQVRDKYVASRKSVSDLLDLPRNDETRLHEPLYALLREHERVLLVTDTQGAQTLAESGLFLSQTCKRVGVDLVFGQVIGSESLRRVLVKGSSSREE